MNITEEQKQEAEYVVNTYSFLTDHFGNFDILCAIQDRQSVLDKMLGLKSYISKADYHNVIRVEIQSLTNQIDYLKSKI